MNVFCWRASVHESTTVFISFWFRNCEHIEWWTREDSYTGVCRARCPAELRACSEVVGWEEAFALARCVHLSIPSSLYISPTFHTWENTHYVSIGNLQRVHEASWGSYLTYPFGSEHWLTHCSATRVLFPVLEVFWWERTVRVFASDCAESRSKVDDFSKFIKRIIKTTAESFPISCASSREARFSVGVNQRKNMKKYRLEKL